MPPMGCAACDHADREAIEQALGARVPLRQLERVFGVGRGPLARHRDGHMRLPIVGPVAGRDHFAESIPQASRADSEQLRLRALEGVRAAVALELRDHSRSRSALRRPTDGQSAQLEANVDEAWAAYDRVRSGGVDLALRALGGIRRPRGPAGRARTWSGGTIDMTIDIFGELIPVTVPADEAFDMYGIPPERRGDRLQVALGWPPSGPDVRTYNAKGKLTWRRASDGGEPPPRMASAHELPLGSGNGNGKH